MGICVCLSPVAERRLSARRWRDQPRGTTLILDDDTMRFSSDVARGLFCSFLIVWPASGARGHGGWVTTRFASLWILKN